MSKILRTARVLVFLLCLPLLAQSADQEVVSVVDAPDPVAPGAALSYTVTLRNNGPDPATNGGVNINLPGAVTHTTDVVPAGWTCFWLGNNGTCNTPSFAAGTTEVLTINAEVGAHLIAFPDQTIDANFFPSGTTSDPNNANNARTASTLVDSPQIDVSVAVSDSPDPVFPDGNITYTVTVANAGPDTAANVNLSSFGSNNLRFVSATVPAGWNCTLPPSGTQTTSFSCTVASLVGGDSDVLTFVMQADDDILGINDGTIQFGFTANGSGNDTVPGNSTETESTTYVTPDADVSVAVTDSPDPVFPDGNITYTVTVANAGPDTAPNITLSSFGGNNLRFVSATIPAGWSCTLPASGTQTTSFSCTLASMVSGDGDVLTFVMQADDDILGINDGTILFGFSANSSVSDPVPGNNAETESTAYVTPDADVSVAVTDSPDPVFPDGNITYTVTVANAGPDTAPNMTLSSFGGNNLRFVSAMVPAGWNCTLPSSGTQTTSFSCTLASMVSGDSDVLTFVMQADDALLGTNDGTIQFGFSANSSISDPVPGNNSETESTAYTTPDADVSISATDSPDPVGPDGDITYTVTVSNAGPDAAQAQLAVPMNGTLKFTSITVPAGFTCSSVPAPGDATSFGCSNPLFESGASAVFTIVLRADQFAFPFNDQVITQSFSVTGGVSDPNVANNSVTVSTNYDVPDANLSITASDAPDPVLPGAVLTYSGAIANAGEDDAINAMFTIPLAPGLLFQSIAAPAGFSCTTPAIGASGTITCTAASLAGGAGGSFTLIAQVDAALNAGPDGTIEQTFTTGSDTRDPFPENNTVTVMTAYLTPDADLSVSTDDAPDPVAPGATLTYTQSVTNSGPDAATNVTFSQALAADVAFTSLAAPAGWTCTTPAVGTIGTITCSRASMPAGTTDTFVLAVDVVITSGTIVNTVTAASETFDADPGDNSDTTSTTVEAPPAADLAITKATPTTTATPGTDIQFTILVTNNGPDAATNVVMTDVLPAALEFLSLSAPAGFTCTTPAAGANGTITCSAATLANGDVAPFLLIVRVASGFDSGTVANTATVSSDTADPNGANGSATSAPIPLAPLNADLAVTKSTSTTDVAPGARYTYTIVLNNDGPDPASNVVVSDVLPASLLFQSIIPQPGFTCATPAVGASGTITCTAGSLAAGASATFILNVLVAPDATGSVVNTATATADTSDPNAANDSSTAPVVTVTPPSANLAITKSTTAATVMEGETFDYTITLSNGGPDTATSIEMTDVLPAGLLFESIVAAPLFSCTTPTAGTNGTITCTTASMTNFAAAVFTVTVRVASGATGAAAINTASATSALPDPDDSNNAGSAPPVVLAAAEAILSIEKTTSASSVTTGDTLVYTIEVSNAGPSVATNVVVTDTLPAGLEYVSATPTQGTCSGTTTVTCSVGSLAVGGSMSITLSSEVIATSGTIANTASVTATESTPMSDTTSPIPVTAPAVPAAAIPTLSEWALLAMALLLGGFAVLKMRSA